MRDLNATLKHAVARKNLDRARDATQAIEVRYMLRAASIAL
jgi:hypothetical protein